MTKPIYCNAWDCVHNQEGYCYVNQDECPELQAFFENRRKSQSEANTNDQTK